MQQQHKSIEQIVAAIEALDLEPIKVKLMDSEEGQGWSREYVERMEIAYKRFLTLFVKFPEQTIAPTKDIDKFWHGHILDTMKYAEDCQNVFGYFLHHFPYFGMRGEQDAANLAQAGRAMHHLYAQEFGEGIPTRSEAAMNAGVAFCGASQKTDAAFCGASKPAFCGASAKADAAFCGASKPAFCGASAKADTAFCGASKPAFCGASAKADTAFCGASKPAFCGASQKADVAFCGACLDATVDGRAPVAA